MFSRVADGAAGQAVPLPQIRLAGQRLAGLESAVQDVVGEFVGEL